jgi:hypothetical protein
VDYDSPYTSGYRVLSKRPRFPCQRSSG